MIKYLIAKSPCYPLGLVGCSLLSAKLPNTLHFIIYDYHKITYYQNAGINSLSHIPHDMKQVAKMKVLEARNLAFGTRYKFFPPWSSN